MFPFSRSFARLLTRLYFPEAFHAFELAKSMAKVSMSVASIEHATFFSVRPIKATIRHGFRCRILPRGRCNPSATNRRFVRDLGPLRSTLMYFILGSHRPMTAGGRKARVWDASSLHFHLQFDFPYRVKVLIRGNQRPRPAATLLHPTAKETKVM